MANVVFLHPDLGIGGAERAMIDAALALKGRGHNVQFLTSHHSTTHCFEETRDGTLKVTVSGNWLPRSICGLCYALCAYLRMMWAALYLIISGIKFDVVICDQVATCVPLLRWFTRAKIIFYCHFPDLLLTERKTTLKRIYRKPLDYLEEYGTGKAHVILVNSQFTAEVFKKTFTSLNDVSPEVVYPIPSFEAFATDVSNVQIEDIPQNIRILFLSINRYERKKNLSLALHAMSKLENLDGVHLVMAGGYDDRVRENVEYYEELWRLREKLSLKDHVTFLRSISFEQKSALLRKATCLIYTPSNEHFGITPLEAMLCQTPVIAVASGGPLETISHNETGYLSKEEPNEFAKYMKKFAENPKLEKTMGEAGERRVKRKFSFEAYSNQLEHIVHDLLR
ncbi:unnamed protein product [Dimorphilus gyrociliatus]|uniref:Alpha-1,3/1,6-mannosyltransferase ALG2 n=1 Tax=Dimorphilus gyrociliatus TaxID=2664684 RepID=A0A7I8W6I4_9ANNE|nr:unnamed protein product [Dimorphilus gyrociliatus]